MRKERMNDKGFSLVELIIVIAIMAILLVVLAPQYLKYVERSRNSTDLQNAVTLRTAIETFAADPQASPAFVKDDTFTITVTATDIKIATGDGVDSAEQALKDAGLVDNAYSGSTGSDDIRCSSRTRWTNYTMQGTVQASGSITWVYGSDGATGDTSAFGAAMKGNS